MLPSSRPQLEVVGPYVRSLPRTRLEERLAWAGAFAVVGLCATEWLLQRIRRTPAGAAGPYPSSAIPSDSE